MAANWATVQRQQDAMHICTEVTLRRAHKLVHGPSQFAHVPRWQTAKFQPPSGRTGKRFF